MSIIEILQNNPVIAAVQYEKILEALNSEVSAVILMYTKLVELLDGNFKIYRKRKPIFIHTDLMKGLSSDSEAIKFVYNYIRPQGIVSTKSHVIRAAKKRGLITIQRVFLIDTKSLENTIESINENNPDAVEIMPGIAPAVIPIFKEKISQPIILAGLIQTHEQVVSALISGADGVSLSNRDLWNEKFKTII